MAIFSHKHKNLATINGSTNQFLLAEKMARHGATDDHIMGIIGEQVPVTQLSLEEQQIQESLIRLDNRLNNIQVFTVILQPYIKTHFLGHKIKSPVPNEWRLSALNYFYFLK